jgi:hypothetical protein
MAQLAYWMYQRQLWDDVYPIDDVAAAVSLKEMKDPVAIRASTMVECSFHRFGSQGQFGVSMMDSRGCRSFGYIPGDERPFMSSPQWNAFECAFDDTTPDTTPATGISSFVSTPPRGFFASCRLILAVSSITSVFLGTQESKFVLGKFDVLRDKLSLGLHPKEQIDYLLTLYAWKQRGFHQPGSIGSNEGNTREVLLIGGDLHFAVHTDIRLPPLPIAPSSPSSSHRSPSRQLNRSPIVNRQAPKRHKGDGNGSGDIKDASTPLSSPSTSPPTPSSPSSSSQPFEAGDLMFQQLIVTAISNDPVGPRSFDAWRANCCSSHQNIISDGISDRRILFRHNDFINNPNFGYIRMHAPPIATASIPSSSSSSSTTTATTPLLVGRHGSSPSMSPPPSPSLDGTRRIPLLLTPFRATSGNNNGVPRSPIFKPTQTRPSETTDTVSHTYISAPQVLDPDTLVLDAPAPAKPSSSFSSLSSSLSQSSLLTKTASSERTGSNGATAARSLAVAGPGSLTLKSTPTIEARVISPVDQWWDHHQKRARPSRD